MQTGVIVRRNPDAFIPDSFLELVIKNNGSAWGAAIIDGEEGLKTNTGGKEDLTPQFFKDTMETFPNRAITFYFCNSDGAVNDGDLFPQVLVDDDGNPKMVVFVDANLPGFEKKDSSVSPATHFVDDWLRPKLEELAELTDGDIDKIMNHCGKDNFRKDILSQAVSRGAITLMSDKSSLSFSVGDTAREFPWGWTSNHYGFGSEKVTEPPKEKKSMFAKKSTTREPVATAIENNQKVVSQTPVSAVADKLKESASIKPKYSVKKGKPEGNLSRKDRKGWYGSRIGYYPVGGDKSVEIEYYVDQTGKLLRWSEVKSLGLDAVGLPKLNNPPRADQKDIEPDNLPESNQPNNQPEKPVTVEVLPIMSPKTREYFTSELGRDDVKKIIAETGDVVATAEQAKVLETKYQDFMVQLGRKDISITDMMKMPYEWLLRVGREKPEGLALLAWNWKNMLLPRLAKESKKEPTAAAEPEKVPEAPPAPKKSMFAKKAAA